MLIIKNLQLVPASLILFIASTPTPAQALEPRWPYNLAPGVKYFPEDEPLVKRNIDIQTRLVDRKPIGVQKMSSDEGEMFFLEYWRFEGGNQAPTLRDELSLTEKRVQSLGLRSDEGDSTSSDAWFNTTFLPPLQAPFSLHAISEEVYHGPLSPRAVLHLLSRRGFQCPTGTASCSTINRPNSCCPTGEACQLITDVGLGDVGCCAQGQSCSNQVSNCQQGYTSCPGSAGGGCCIPGYTCNGVGCVVSSTTTVVINPSATATPSSRATPTPSTSTTVVIVPAASPSSSTTQSSPPPSTSSTTTPTSSSLTPSSLPSAIIITTTSTSTSPSSSATPPLTCSQGYQSCPASLGGGCCPTDRACASASCPATSITTTPASSLAAPVRPTSNSDTATTITSAPATLTGSTCPTGFYQCSAYYHGGCCRVGRDCGMTSCPGTVSSTQLISNGVTVVAVTATAGCAVGWFDCGTGGGGGCCPSGFGCGSGSCTTTGTGAAGVTGSVVAKEPTSGGLRLGVGRGAVVGVCVGLMMVLM